MKKSLLALAVLGAFAASAQAQSSVTIYGILDTGITYQSKGAKPTPSTGNGSVFSMQSGVMSGSRFGFKGSEDLGGGLKANFQLEAGINVDDGSFSGQDASGSTVMFRRISTVGLSGGFGSVNLGRQTDFAYSGLGGGGTNVYSSAGYFGGFTGTNGTTQARLQGDRTNNAIRYDMNAIGGLTGGLMYGMGEQAGGGSAGAAYAAGLKYENGPLSVGGSYFKSKLGNTPADRALYSGSTTALANTNYNLGDQGTTTWTLGAKYNFGSSLLYGNWSRVKMQAYGTGTGAAAATFNSASIANTTSANNQLDMYEIGYNYDLTASLKLLTGFSHTKVGFTSGSGLPQGKLDQLSLGTDYFLSKRTDLYTLATYARTTNVSNPLKLSSSNGSVAPATGTTGGAFGVAVGIRHAF